MYETSVSRGVPVYISFLWYMTPDGWHAELSLVQSRRGWVKTATSRVTIESPALCHTDTSAPLHTICTQ